jgi:outer membrane protein assembly factor BamB
MRPLAVLLVTAVTAVTTRAADWPQHLGPNRDGTSAETGLNWAWPVGGPPVRWSVPVGAGFAGPVVSGGRVYLFHRVEDDEVLTAFDPATGKELWKHARPTKYVDEFGFDPGPRSTPTVADGRIFTLGANGDLAATDTTGKPVWQIALRKQYQADKGYFGVAGSPVLAGGKLLVPVGGQNAGIVAFDPATGKELWTATTDAAGYSSPVVASIQGKEAAVFLTRAGLKVLDPATGTVRLSHPFRSRLDASVNAATPLVRDGDIFLTASYATGAALLRPTGGEVNEVWANDRSLSCHYNTPVRVGDYLYGVHGRQEGGGAELRCVEWATGEVKWKQARFGCASLIAVDGGVLAVTEAGEVVRFAADPAIYKEVGRAKVLAGVTRAAPALAGGRVYLRDDSKLVCVELGK